MSSYDDHLAWLVRQELYVRAERQGYLDAKSFPLPVRFSTDEKEQQYYEDGFYIGKTKLALEGVDSERVE